MFQELLQRSEAVVLGLSSEQPNARLLEIEQELIAINTAIEEENEAFEAADLDGILANLEFISENSHLLPPAEPSSPLPILPTPQKAAKTISAPKTISAAKTIISETTSAPKPISKPKSSNQTFIYPITADEFSEVPHYIAGRQTLEKVNINLEKLEKVFKKWRSIPAQKQSPDMRLDLQRFNKIAASSDFPEGDNAYIRLIDITGKGSTVPKSTFKFDAAGRVALAVAKHLGRLREGRTSEGAYYVAIY